MFIAGMSDPRFLALAAKVPGHFLIDVLEHGLGARRRALIQRAVGFRLLGGLGDVVRQLFLQRLLLLLGPFAELDQMLLEALQGIAQRPAGGLVGGTVFAGVVAGG